MKFQMSLTHGKLKYSVQSTLLQSSRNVRKYKQKQEKFNSSHSPKSHLTFTKLFQTCYVAD